MTEWVEAPAGGRDRGPRGIARAWVEVMVRPRRFFENGVAPADQAPGLVFAVLVSFLYVSGLLALDPGAVPEIGGGGVVSASIVLAAVSLLVTPLSLHLLAAIQTVTLVPFVSERAGIGETVQVLAYASAPCVFASIPLMPVRVASTAYAAVLLVIGLRVRHDTTTVRAILSAAAPAAIIFGFAFGGFDAISTLVSVGNDGGFIGT